MADKMEFPKTMKEFIYSCSFKDEEEIYTNGAELVMVCRVEQALEHYEREIRARAIDEFAERLRELCGMEIGDYQYPDLLHESRIDEIAEQMKGGAE